MAGCTQTVKPIPTSVEQPVQVEQPTDIPLEEPTEVPTVMPTPTEEPTEVPTEVPTPTEEPVICPRAFTLPDDLSIDLGEYGTFHLIDEYPVDIITVGTPYSVVTNQGEFDLKSEGGTVSFLMKSRGLLVFDSKAVTLEGKDLIVLADRAITIDGEDFTTAVLVPSQTEIKMTVEPGVVVDKLIPLLSVYYETGEEIVLDENALRIQNGSWSASCHDGYYIIEVKADDPSTEVVMSSNYALTFKDFSNLEGFIFSKWNDLLFIYFVGAVIPPGEEVNLRLSGGSTFTVIPLPLLQGETPWEEILKKSGF